MASHKFYVPVGVVALPAAPSSPDAGDTYFDTTLGFLRTWDGLVWVAGGSTEVAVQDAEPADVDVLWWVDPDGVPSQGVSEGPTGPMGPVGGIGPTGPVGPNVVSTDVGNISTISVTDSFIFTPRDVTKLDVAGGVLTGPLTLAADPVADAEAASKAYVDARIWQGTQAEFDAIITKDPTVLYVVTG